MLNYRLLLIAAVGLAGPPLGAFAAVPDAAAPPPATAPVTPTVQLAPSGDMADTLKASGQFTILTRALDASNLTSVLRRTGPMTLLAPTDAAFKSLPPATLDSLMKPENASRLQALLAYHLINAIVPPSKVQGAKGPVKTVAGPDVVFDGSGSPIKVNGADVEGEAQASNGEIYVIDQVLMPSAAPASAGATAAPGDRPG